MRWTRNFIVGQRSLGSAPAASNFVHAELACPLGVAFFCPLCGVVWGGGYVEGEATQVRHRPCIEHDLGERLGGSSMGVVSHYDIPGSMLLSESKTWNDSLTPEIWERELRVTLRWAAHNPATPISVASLAQDMLSLLSTNRKGLK